LDFVCMFINICTTRRTKKNKEAVGMLLYIGRKPCPTYRHAQADG